MKCLDLTLPTPAENLACDEALLDRCEGGGGHEVLRFWEPPEYFVVVGYANRVATEVNVAACQARTISILRRSSGGGTVLQGPGCLNYSLILRIDKNRPLHSITSANRFIMERNRAAVQAILSACRHDCSPSASPVRTPGAEPQIQVCGHTDLALGTLKVSGNAQRRKKHSLLFHGSFLLQMDLNLIEALLRMPSRQPEYRQSRPHGRFLANLELPADDLKRTLQKTWKAWEPCDSVPHRQIELLTRDRYATIGWNMRF